MLSLSLGARRPGRILTSPRIRVPANPQGHAHSPPHRVSTALRRASNNGDSKNRDCNCARSCLYVPSAAVCTSSPGSAGVAGRAVTSRGDVSRRRGKQLTQAARRALHTFRSLVNRPTELVQQPHVRSLSRRDPSYTSKVPAREACDPRAPLGRSSSAVCA